MSAPSCPISNPQQKVLSQRQPLAPDIAHVPTAHDLLSVITAINQMNNIVQHITRGLPQINNFVVPSVRISSEPPERQEPPQYPQITWNEISRDYHDDEVVNPDDEKQRVEIKTLARIIWQEDTTEQRVVYKGRR